MSGLQNFDPVWCGKAWKVATVASVVALLVSLVIMLTFESRECPGWVLPGRGGIPLWTLLVLIIVPAVAAAVYRARNWDAFAHRVIHGTPKPETNLPPTPFEKIISSYETDELYAATFQYNKMFLLLGVGWVLFCSMPLLLIAVSCVTWH